MRRREFLTSLPVIAALVAAPLAPAVPDLVLPRLADLFAVVEFQDMHVLKVGVGPKTFRRIAEESGTDTGGRAAFRYWNADIFVGHLDEDEAMLFGNHSREYGDLRRTHYFRLSWSSDEGERTYYDRDAESGLVWVTEPTYRG